ncbi:MAG: 4-hydroxy-tetrahydrodipicolinate reductase [Cyanobacteriota bacterium]
MSINKINVLVCGACGKMGTAVVEAVLEQSDLDIVALVDTSDELYTKATSLLGSNVDNIILETSLSKGINTANPDVVVDFTNPNFVYDHTKTIIENGARPVIGTTGLTIDQITELSLLIDKKKLGGLVAPNFAIGAVLMMEFSKKAAKYFDHVEIVELHHNKKLDAPSGTAIKTAEMMGEMQKTFSSTNVKDKELLQGARGAVSEKNIHIHSIRLPGLVAHQEVYLAGSSQMLTIRHDSFDRKSFMPGVIIAIRNVMSQSKLIYGLENIL